MKGEQLSARQARFVADYMIDLNATQAAIRAGYSPRTARAQGSRLLTNVAVEKAIVAAKASRIVKSGITAERVLRETEALAHSNVDHYLCDEVTGRLVLAPGAPPNAMQAVSAVKYKTMTYGMGELARVERSVEFKLWDKPGMVKLAGRHVDVHGFADRVELTGKDGGAIETAVTLYEMPSNGR